MNKCDNCCNSFVANFVSNISAKYYLNWFSFHTVIMEVIGVNFFETQCSYYCCSSPVIMLIIYCCRCFFFLCCLILEVPLLIVIHQSCPQWLVVTHVYKFADHPPMEEANNGRDSLMSHPSLLFPSLPFLSLPFPSFLFPFLSLTSLSSSSSIVVVEWSLVPSMRETGPEGHYTVNH